MVSPVLVALGSIPRKYFGMAETPNIEMAITTGTRDEDPTSPLLYYIRFEVTLAKGIVPEIFMMTRQDPTVNSYTYSRVASLRDLANYGTSSFTDSDAYRTSEFTYHTNSLAHIKDLKDGVPRVVNALLDEIANSHKTDEFGTVTLSLTGSESN